MRKVSLILGVLKMQVVCALLISLVISCSHEVKGPAGPIPTIESFTPGSGDIDVTVTITGSNFSATSSDIVVLFNGVVASVTSSSATQIVTKVPTGATSGKITVKVKGVAGISTTDFKVVPNPWTILKSYGGYGRQYAVGLAIGNKGYIGLGESVTTYFKDFWEYDPTANTWTQKADFGGVGRSRATGFTVGSKGYVGTGRDTNGTRLKDFWEFDPVSNTWSQKADFGGAARLGAVGFAIGSKGYIGCGDPQPVSWGAKDFWEYNPSTNAWAQKADVGGNVRIGAVGFAIGTKGYIGTGGQSLQEKDFWEYNPVDNTWTNKADFGGGYRQDATAFVVGNVAYVGTGYVGSFPDQGLKDFWKFDPSANTWIRVTDFFGGKTINFGYEDGVRYAASSFTIGTKGYVGVGTGDIHSNTDFWQYTPE